ncbi:MAG: hypothetical protein WBV94_33375 [Blastocatellia bacterium]
MWSQDTSRRIAGILNLIAETPNQKPHPHDCSIRVFDGGMVKTGTGLTDYEFSDGTRATYGTGLDIHLRIVFPGEEEVTLHSSHVYCGGCLSHLSADSRYCYRCGLENRQGKP